MVSVVGRMLRHKMCAVSVAVVGGADALQSVRFPLLFSVVHSVLSILPSVYAPLPYYPAYSQYPGSYRSSYGLAPYSSSFYGKPSYAYSNPNNGYAGVSAYEGPSYGMNAYWQPGIAYSPNGAYGSYAAGGYGGAAGGYGGAATPYGGLSSPYGGMGPYGDLCRDRSADCALTASSGQCAMTARILCPQSCGVGCAGGVGLPYPQSPYYADQQGYSQQLANTGGYGYGSAYGTAYNSGGGYGSVLGGDYGSPTNGAGYGAAAAAAGGDYGGGPSFACRDSHLYGCQQWAAQGLCQQTPDYMQNYCRASCNVCNGGTQYGSLSGAPNGGSGYGPGVGGYGPASGGVFGANGYGVGGGQPYGVPPGSEYGGQGFGPLGNFGNIPPAATSQFASGPFPAFTTPTDLAGAEFAGGVSPSAPMPPLNSFYSPFYPYRSLLSSANERKEEKQQKGAKVLFSEDEPTSEQSSWTAGLPSASSTGTGTGTGTSIFEQSPSRMSALFNTAAASADGAPLTMSWPPPSSLSTQHSSLSKLVRMDDLVMDKAKEKKSKS
uniref:ShKT domain-containing protein n=1 Tax=Globodera rostochiensis TaxID=31243 RepID=A0A914I7A5_GLORO